MSSPLTDSVCPAPSPQVGARAFATPPPSSRSPNPPRAQGRSTGTRPPRPTPTASTLSLRGSRGRSAGPHRRRRGPRGAGKRCRLRWGQPPGGRYVSGEDSVPAPPVTTSRATVDPPGVVGRRPVHRTRAPAYVGHAPAYVGTAVTGYGEPCGHEAKHLMWSQARGSNAPLSLRLPLYEISDIARVPVGPGG